ncbi:CD209 antigen-like protein A [Lemmus lemmus]
MQEKISEQLTQLKTEVSKVPSSHVQDKIYQELMQLKTEVLKLDKHRNKKIQIWVQPDLPLPTDSLCRRCPWDWTFFKGNCYFFSKSQRDWHNSITACQEVGAQLVTIKSHEEQNFLQQTSKKRGYTWMGLIDINKESTWHWVDGSPLTLSFMKYWNKGEPNNLGDEDCAEFRDEGWNDSKCYNKKFWICKKPKASCPSK